jgi:Tfp pilus assembly protein PilV
MSSVDSARAEQRRMGFTLIEVVGALVIFSVGVLMVMQVGGALTTQLRYAGARSEIAVLTSEQLDSISATPFDSISAGTTVDTVNVQGWTYQRSVIVTSITPVLAKIEVALAAIGSGGPSHSVTSYTSAAW